MVLTKDLGRNGQLPPLAPGPVEEAWPHKRGTANRGTNAAGPPPGISPVIHSISKGLIASVFNIRRSIKQVRFHQGDKMIRQPNVLKLHQKYVMVNLIKRFLNIGVNDINLTLRVKNIRDELCQAY
nr:unnamed protein product [Callosobruchus chinensis]